MKTTFLPFPSIVILIGILLVPFVNDTYAHANDLSPRTMSISIAAPGWPPYTIIDGQSGPEKRGIMLDVMAVVLQRIGYQLKLESHPAKRVLLLLEEGQIDATTKAREWVTEPDKFLWSNPIVDSEDVLICRKKSYTDLDTLINTKDARIAGKLGFTYPSLQEAIDQQRVRWYTAASTENLLKMLNYGHADAIVTNKLVAQWILESSHDDLPIKLYYSKPIDSTPFRFAFAKKEAMYPFVEKFNLELEKLRQDGTLATIIGKYQ